MGRVYALILFSIYCLGFGFCDVWALGFVSSKPSLRACFLCDAYTEFAAVPFSGRGPSIEELEAGRQMFSFGFPSRRQQTLLADVGKP